MSEIGNTNVATSSTIPTSAVVGSAEKSAASNETHGAGDGPKITANVDKAKTPPLSPRKSSQSRPYYHQQSPPRKFSNQNQPQQHSGPYPERKFSNRQYSDQRLPFHQQNQQFQPSWRKTSQSYFDRYQRQQSEQGFGGNWFQQHRPPNRGGYRRGSSRSVTFHPQEDHRQSEKVQRKISQQNQYRPMNHSSGDRQNNETDDDRRRNSTGDKNRKKSDAVGPASSPGKPAKAGASGNRSVSETMENGSADFDYLTDDFELEEPFSDSDEEETPQEREARLKRQAKPHLMLPVGRRRIRTLSGMIPAVGYAPVWGGPTMCLNCLEFFDLPKQTSEYVQHLLDKHKVVITDIELIVDLKRYIEHWRHRFGQDPIEKVFPLVTPKEGDQFYGKVDDYYLMSEKVPEDRQIRERLALRRLEEVLSCQQREREDRTFNRHCLFCRYRTKGNRAKLVHHLYTIHHLNLGSPDNLVFVSEYLDVLEGKLKKNECIYCEKVFPDHQVLTEHMRKKQHREVNPNNNYYDRFYVINYLELGKKWLEVLAEDFEDNTPAFVDSDEEEEEESWNEWQEDAEDENEATAVCLFCDESFEEPGKLLDHMKNAHQYDLKKVFVDGQFGFYDRVKFINYIRKLSHQFVCFVCGTDDLRSWQALRKHLANSVHMATPVDKEKWDKEEYLIPTYDNDTLLYLLEDVLDLDDDLGSFVGKGDPEADKDDKAPGGESSTTEAGANGIGPEKGDLAIGESSTNITVIPEDLPLLVDSALNDPELREQLK